MRRTDAGILYIGKAKSLKKRVNSYFRSRAPHAEHILEMLSRARDVDFSPTGSALEAALLESDEIKRHLPPYNKALRPDRRSLVYLTRNLRACSPASDQYYCIGPLPADRLIEAFQEFAAWLECGLRLPADDLAPFGHLIRRARWYALLSESCLGWTPAGSPHGPKNLLVIERGRIIRKDILPAGQKVPAPPGLERSWPHRRKALDLAAYDRLRVLTTELRRLVCDGRSIELRLGPKAGLALPALKKDLPWI